MTQINPAIREAFRPGRSAPAARPVHALLGAALFFCFGTQASAQPAEPQPSSLEASESAPTEPAAPAAPTESAPVTSEPVPVTPVEPTALSPEQSRALLPLSWKKSPGQGVSMGIEEGLWGSSWGQGLRVTVPFSSNFGTTLRGLYVIDMVDGAFTADAGGRLDFFGRSDVMFNVLRLYGGGGVQVFAPVANTSGRSVGVGGGGHFGFEFFCSPFYSFFLEVGGQGGTVSPGATVLAGMMFYPWTR